MGAICPHIFFRIIYSETHRKATLGFFIGQPQQHNNTAADNQPLTNFNYAFNMRKIQNK